MLDEGSWREFKVLPVLDKLLGRGFTAALPVVVGKGQPLEFRDWNRDTKLASGVWDIPYPAEGTAVMPNVLISAGGRVRRCMAIAWAMAPASTIAHWR